MSTLLPVLPFHFQIKELFICLASDAHKNEHTNESKAESLPQKATLAGVVLSNYPVLFQGPPESPSVIYAFCYQH